MAVLHFCYSLSYPQTVFLQVFQSHRSGFCSPFTGKSFQPSSPNHRRAGLTLRSALRGEGPD